jgi:hypothetical protein
MFEFSLCEIKLISCANRKKHYAQEGNNFKYIINIPKCRMCVEVVMFIVICDFFYYWVLLDIVVLVC